MDERWSLSGGPGAGDDTAPCAELFHSTRAPWPWPPPALPEPLRARPGGSPCPPPRYRRPAFPGPGRKKVRRLMLRRGPRPVARGSARNCSAVPLRARVPRAASLHRARRLLTGPAETVPSRHTAETGFPPRSGTLRAVRDRPTDMLFPPFRAAVSAAFAGCLGRDRSAVGAGRQPTLGGPQPTAPRRRGFTAIRPPPGGGGHAEAGLLLGRSLGRDSPVLTSNTGAAGDLLGGPPAPPGGLYFVRRGRGW